MLFKFTTKVNNRPVVKSYEDPQDNHWLNLATGRKIIKLDKDKYALRDHRFVGSIADLKQLFDDNPSVFAEKDFDHELFLPLNDLEALVSSEVCSLNQTITIDSSINDIEQLDPKLLKTLCPFTLHNLFTKAFITSVHDGDTLNCAIILSTRDISQCGKGKNCSLLQQEGKIVTVFTCRLFGIDSAELNTDEGKVQAGITKGQLEDKYVWIQFLGKEKFGRELAVIYWDDSKRCIYQPQGVGYLGGKKGEQAQPSTSRQGEQAQPSTTGPSATSKKMTVEVVGMCDLNSVATSSTSRNPVTRPTGPRAVSPTPTRHPAPRVTTVANAPTTGEGELQPLQRRLRAAVTVALAATVTTTTEPTQIRRPAPRLTRVVPTE